MRCFTRPCSCCCCYRCCCCRWWWWLLLLLVLLPPPQLNKEIFEALYYGAVSASMEVARDGAGPYETFKGSPMSEGE